MSDPTSRNRLAAEESPYLKQHADNPVNWQPWDETALAAAQERDVPIFLSIGYAACHWCHVMAEESFEDPDIAAILNEHFVPIKVDREERPDIDSIYMTVCQYATGRGGWPLSAWLTPDGRPFHVGTYFPPESRDSMPGFRELLEGIHEGWTSERSSFEEQADTWAQAAREQLEETPRGGDRPVPGSTALRRMGDAAVRQADRDHGGFGHDGPKFPQPVRLLALAHAAARQDRPNYQSVLVESLEAMASGGLYDHVGGGFHRYCVDSDWTVPHFEKMLYDNAMVPQAYLAGYQLTGRDDFARTVTETLSFVDRDLGMPDGGFYSTLDARSEASSGEREEGAYYVWTPELVADAIEDDDLADLVRARYGITDEGNFEGSTVLTRAASIDELATEFDMAPETVRSSLAAGRETLFEARSQRPAPPRDEKVLAGWNGMMIETFAAASLVLDEPAYGERAMTALEFVIDTLWDEDDQRLQRRYADGVTAIDGYLDDYAFLARGALRCHEATGALEPLAIARDLAAAIVRDFWDEESETLYLTPTHGEQLLSRPQDLSDQSTPSATGAALDVLLALDAVVADDWDAIVDRVLSTHAERLSNGPLEHVGLLLAADRLATGSIEITVAAEAVPRSWRVTIGGRFLSHRFLTRRPPTDEGLEPWLDRFDREDVPPLWAGREARDGEPTLYVCQNRTCSPPKHDVEEALAWLD